MFDVQLSIQVVPCDEGVMVLAEANEDYVRMIDALRNEYGGEYDYIVPADDKDSYLYTTGVYDASILASRHLLHTLFHHSLYRQPYSEVEIGKWFAKIEHHFECMKVQFKNILSRQDSDRHAAKLEELIIQ